jgi:hypothetical protein
MRAYKSEMPEKTCCLEFQTKFFSGKDPGQAWGDTKWIQMTCTIRIITRN